MSILLINFENVLPELRSFDGVIDYYQIGLLDREQGNFICRNNSKRLIQTGLQI